MGWCPRIDGYCKLRGNFEACSKTPKQECQQKLEANNEIRRRLDEKLAQKAKGDQV